MKTKKLKTIIENNANLIFADGVLEKITADIMKIIEDRDDIPFPILFISLRHWFNTEISGTITLAILKELAK